MPERIQIMHEQIGKFKQQYSMYDNVVIKPITQQDMNTILEVSGNGVTTTEIEQIIHDYLVKNHVLQPEAVVKTTSTYGNWM